jgi:ATP-dependent DNA ligase
LLRQHAVTTTQSGMLALINPAPRAEPFDHPDWVFEAKSDGFRVAADTVRVRLLSLH